MHRLLENLKVAIPNSLSLFHSHWSLSGSPSLQPGVQFLSLRWSICLQTWTIAGEKISSPASIQCSTIPEIPTGGWKISSVRYSTYFHSSIYLMFSWRFSRYTAQEDLNNKCASMIKVSNLGQNGTNIFSKYWKKTEENSFIYMYEYVYMWMNICFIILFCFILFLLSAGDAIQNYSALFLESSSLNITHSQESSESMNTSQKQERRLSLASTNSENSGSAESLSSACLTNSEWSLLQCA